MSVIAEMVNRRAAMLVVGGSNPHVAICSWSTEIHVESPLHLILRGKAQVRQARG